jgi:hypothetical protein
VRVRSDRRHDFAVAPDELWTAMQRVDTYRAWWPWLRELQADSLEPGAVWSAVVQPPLPYRLRFELRIDEAVAATRVSAEVTGDIEGSARLEITATPRGSLLHLVSDLAPRTRLLRTVATIAGPVVRYGHDWVLDTGVRQFEDRALS